MRPSRWLLGSMMIGGLLATGCAGDDELPTSSGSPPAAATAETDEPAPDAAEAERSADDDVDLPDADDAAPSGATDSVHRVEARDADGFAFSPAELTVAVGDTVMWEMAGEVSHTVTGAGGLSSGILEPGESFEATFDEPGSFEYLCYLHPGMAGTVTVG